MLIRAYSHTHTTYITHKASERKKSWWMVGWKDCYGRVRFFPFFGVWWTCISKVKMRTKNNYTENLMKGVNKCCLLCDNSFRYTPTENLRTNSHKRKGFQGWLQSALHSNALMASSSDASIRTYTRSVIRNLKMHTNIGALLPKERESLRSVCLAVGYQVL